MAPPWLGAPPSSCLEEQPSRSWAGRVEAIVQELLNGNRAEARLWLCSSIGALQVPVHVQARCFNRLSTLKDSDGNAVVRQLVRMLCQNRPSWAIKAVSADPSLIRSFFSGHPKRIEQWFEKFSTSGEMDHQWGARALAQFTFIHRETCWSELEWKGNHGQSPVIVATKPYYFLELDVLRTVENFLDRVPSFWTSEELRDSLQDGDLLFLDIEYFTEKLSKKLIYEHDYILSDLVKDYLENEMFSVLCTRLLHLISEKSLLDFVNELAEELSGCSWKTRKRDHSPEICKQPSGFGDVRWLENILMRGTRCLSLEDMMISIACTNHGRQLLQLLREEEWEDVSRTFKQLVLEARSEDVNYPEDIRPLINNFAVDKWACIKWLALESWFLLAWLVEEFTNNDLVEATLNYNNIDFVRSSKVGADSDERMKIKKRRRKQKKYGHSDVVDETTWKLALDDYSHEWWKGDLPAYLSSYGFGKWVQHVM